MTIYYFSSVHGSDSNTGTSADQAWNSFSKLKVNALKPGDEILLDRGSEFAQQLTIANISGTTTAPITIGAYGTGADPVLDAAGGKGILASNASNFILQNITIQNTGDSAMYGSHANNWVIQNVTFKNNGEVYANGAISWANSANLTVNHATVADSHGDGIYMAGVTNVVVENSTFNNVHGKNADNVQISGTSVVVANNVMTIDPASDTTKGNLIFQGSDFYAHDNYLQGGNYGVSLSANNVVVANNTMKDHAEGSWSSNINITDQVTGDTMHNVAIQGNHLYDAGRNITIDGMNTTAAHMAVTGLTITNNDFHDWIRTPVLLNGADVTGTYANNTYDATNNGLVNTNNSNVTGLNQYNNTYTAPPAHVLLAAGLESEPPAASPSMSIPVIHMLSVTAAGDSFDGAPLMQLYQNGVLVGQLAVDAARSAGGKETLSFDLANISDTDTFTVRFTNDKVDAAAHGDRNLYVYGINLDGATANLHDADLSAKVVFMKDKSGLFFSSNANATFDVGDFHTSSGAVLHYSDILDDSKPIIPTDVSHAVIATAPAAPMAYPASDTLVHALDTLHQAAAQNFG